MIYSLYSCAEDPLYHPVVIKDIQRFWKRILIVDDDVDVTTTFRVVLEDNNNSTDLNRISSKRKIYSN